MTSLELFEHRYNKGQKFSWLEMIDFAEAYASQSPEPNTVTEDSINTFIEESVSKDNTYVTQVALRHYMELAIKWALQQTQAVGVSESKIFEIIADKFPDYNVPYCTEVAEVIANKLNQKKSGGSNRHSVSVKNKEAEI